MNYDVWFQPDLERIKQDSVLTMNVKTGNIIPKHIFLSTSNTKYCRKVNQKKEPPCSWCRGTGGFDVALNVEKLFVILDSFVSLGTKAVTFNGPNAAGNSELESIAYWLQKKNVSVGLITNAGSLTTKTERGSRQHRLTSFTSELISLLDRVQVYGSSEFYLPYKTWIYKVKQCNKVTMQWILSDPTKIEGFYNWCEAANKISSVVDLIVTPNPMDTAEQYITKLSQFKDALPNSLQCRLKPTYAQPIQKVAGNRKCLVSLLRPQITHIGEVYPCPYIFQATKDRHQLHSTKRTLDIYKEWDKQLAFDGTVCRDCPYGELNEYLNYWHDDYQRNGEFVWV